MNFECIYDPSRKYSKFKQLSQLQNQFYLRMRKVLNISKFKYLLQYTVYFWGSPYQIRSTWYTRRHITKKRSNTCKYILIPVSFSTYVPPILCQADLRTILYPIRIVRSKASLFHQKQDDTKLPNIWVWCPVQHRNWNCVTSTQIVSTKLFNQIRNHSKADDLGDFIASVCLKQRVGLINSQMKSIHVGIQ